MLDFVRRPDKGIRLRVIVMTIAGIAERGLAETGNFRAESATSCHPSRLASTSRTANQSRWRSTKITDAHRHLEADEQLGAIVVKV